MLHISINKVFNIINFFQRYGGLRFAICPKFQSKFISGRYKIHSKDQVELVTIFGTKNSYFGRFLFGDFLDQKMPKTCVVDFIKLKNSLYDKKYKLKVFPKVSTVNFGYKNFG